MNTIKHSVLPTFVSRTVKMAALLGSLIGAVMCFLNKNDLFASVVIISGLGLAFAVFSRWLAVTVLRAWLETKIEEYKKRQVEEDKQLEEAKAAKDAAKEAALKEAAKKK